MGALAKIRESELVKIVGATVGEAFNAFVGMVNFQEGESLEEAIASAKKENPAEAKELENFEKVAVLTDKDLNEKAEKQFIIVEPKKDEDGYNKILDKIGDIGATVSEKKAEADMKQRQKGGKQKTRVDEE